MLSASERRTLVERDAQALPLQTQANLLSLSRASLYYQPVPPSPEEVTIKHRIDELSTESPFYGSRNMTAVLRREGHGINRKRVQGYMQEMGIAALRPKPNLSKQAMQHRIFPYLLRGTMATAPNHIWGCDITYIRVQHGWLYLVAILDWYSRYVVNWMIDDTMELPFVVAALRQALATATPMIWNTDQGSQFTSPQVTTLLMEAGVQISMDGRGRAFDNIFTERFWRSLKYENIYLSDYSSPRAARQGMSDYITFYNQKRLHQALAYRTPAEVYAQGASGVRASGSPP